MSGTAAAARPTAGAKKRKATEPACQEDQSMADTRHRLMGAAFFTSALMGLMPLQQLLQVLRPQQPNEAAASPGAQRPSKHRRTEQRAAGIGKKEEGRAGRQGVFEALGEQQAGSEAAGRASPGPLAAQQEQQCTEEAAVEQQSQQSQQQQQQSQQQQQYHHHQQQQPSDVGGGPMEVEVADMPAAGDAVQPAGLPGSPAALSGPCPPDPASPVKAGAAQHAEQPHLLAQQALQPQVPFSAEKGLSRSQLRQQLQQKRALASPAPAGGAADAPPRPRAGLGARAGGVPAARRGAPNSSRGNRLLTLIKQQQQGQQQEPPGPQPAAEGEPMGAPEPTGAEQLLASSEGVQPPGAAAGRAGGDGEGEGCAAQDPQAEQEQPAAAEAAAQQQQQAAEAAAGLGPQAGQAQQLRGGTPPTPATVELPYLLPGLTAALQGSGRDGEGRHDALAAAAALLAGGQAVAAAAVQQQAQQRAHTATPPKPRAAVAGGGDDDTPGPSPLHGGARGTAAAALQRVGELVADLASPPPSASKRRRSLLGVLVRGAGAGSGGAAQRAAQSAAETGAGTAGVPPASSSQQQQQQQGPKHLADELCQPPPLSHSPADFAALSPAPLGNPPDALQPSSNSTHTSLPASPGQPFPGFWAAAGGSQPAAAVPAAAAAGEAGGAPAACAAPAAVGAAAGASGASGQASRACDPGSRPAQQAQQRPADSPSAAGRRERKVRFAVPPGAEEDDEEQRLPGPTPTQPPHPHAASRPGTLAKPSLPKMPMPAPPAHARFGSLAFRRYNGPASRRAALLSFVCDSGSSCVAFAPAPPGGAASPLRAGGRGQAAAVGTALEPPLNVDEEESELAAEEEAATAGLLGCGEPDGTTAGPVSIPRRTRQPPNARRLSAAPEPRSREEAALHDLREAYINSHLADSWRRGEGWARLDLAGVELDAERAPEYQERLDELCAALGAAEGGEAVNRVMARLEGELRQLQRMRQRYAVGPAGAGAGEPEGQQQQQQADAMSAGEAGTAIPRSGPRAAPRSILKQPSSLGPNPRPYPLRSPSASPPHSLRQPPAAPLSAQQAQQPVPGPPAAAAQAAPAAAGHQSVAAPMDICPPLPSADGQEGAPGLSAARAAHEAGAAAAAGQPTASPAASGPEREELSPLQQQQRVQQAQQAGQGAQQAQQLMSVEEVAALVEGSEPAQLRGPLEGPALQPGLQLTPTEEPGQGEGEGLEQPLQLTPDAAVELTPGPAPSRGVKMLLQSGGKAASGAGAAYGASPAGPRMALAFPPRGSGSGGGSSSTKEAVSSVAGAAARRPRASRGARLLQALQLVAQGSKAGGSGGSTAAPLAACGGGTGDKGSGLEGKLLPASEPVDMALG